MGYYINTTNVSAFLPKENIEECNRIWQEANKQDTNKSGGRWAEGKQQEKWFSWMPSDWTDLSPKDILEAMGFEGTEETDKGIVVGWYSSKVGDEEYLMSLVGHLFTGEIEWKGEEGEHWKWVFGPEGMTVLQGRIVY